MRQTPSDQRLRHMLLGSLAAHALGLLLLLGWAQLSARRAPPPQHVLVTKLVRLGTPRPKELLPQKDPPPQAADAPAPTPKAATPPPTPAPPSAAKAAAIAPPVAAPPSAKERAKALSRVNSALAKLKRNVDGQADGSINGETDVAQQGDAYASEINNCIMKNYIIRLLDAGRTAGKSAEVNLWISRDGRITGHKILISTGLPAMDRAISEAIKGCDHVSAPPAALRNEIGKSGISITFQP